MIALIWTAALFVQAGQPSKEIKIESDIPAYAVTLPAGYEPVPGETRYFRSFGRDTWHRITVSFARGSGPLKQNPSGITAEEVLPFVTLPPDATRVFMTVKWKSLDIGVVEHGAVINNIPVVGLSAVLPLRGNALTVTVSGPTPLEKETRDEFRELLSRIGSTKTNWYTAEEFGRMRTLDAVAIAGLVLLALYPVAWAILFRGNLMRAHWLRVVWLLAIAALLSAPVTSPGPTTAFTNLIVNGVLPLVMLSLAVRRIKLGIDA